MRDVLAMILGGGRGSRLYPLTKLRAKPAVPIGGRYRLIDIPISNCLNSDIHKIYVLTQFMSASLHRHIFQTYKFDLFSGGYVDVLAAEETPTGMDWYQGTADAVRKQLPRFGNARVDDVLILSGDHLYRMDYGEYIGFHRDRRADVTIAAQPVSLVDASRFGILKSDEDGRITSFYEKPQADELDGLECVPDNDRPCLASMGIYIFRPDVLKEMLQASDAEDFGRQIIPAAIESRRVYAYQFNGYWEDIGTIRAFYEANLAMTLPDPPFDFYDPQYPIYTRPRFLPPSRADGCHLDNTALAEGCIIERADIRDSVIGLRSTIRADAHLVRTVMMGADFYEAPERKGENHRLGIPDVGIGRGSSIEGAIIDKNARIGENVTIRSHEEEEEYVETDNYTIKEGIVVIPKNAIIPDGAVI
jgi:glucose-1-phosphate adenylyltransferase